MTSTEGLECCLAEKTKSNGAFIAVDDRPAKDVQEDFRTESAFEMKIGFLKQDIILATGELPSSDCKLYFFQDTALPNPWFEDALAFLQTGKDLCNGAGASLCRQLCMRNSEGNCSHKSFSPIQERAMKQYAWKVADLIWFATKCPWDTQHHDLSSFLSILKSILFEPHCSIQQTFMTR